MPLAHLESCRAFAAVIAYWLAFVEEHTHLAEAAVLDNPVTPRFRFFDSFFDHYPLICSEVFKAMGGFGEVKGIGCDMLRAYLKRYKTLFLGSPKNFKNLP